MKTGVGFDVVVREAPAVQGNRYQAAVVEFYKFVLVGVEPAVLVGIAEWV